MDVNLITDSEISELKEKNDIFVYQSVWNYIH